MLRACICDAGRIDDEVLFTQHNIKEELTMSDFVLTLIEFAVPLVVGVLALSLTCKHLKKILLGLTDEEDVAKLFTRMFAITTLLGALVWPFANQPCGIQQLLNYIGISFLIVLITLFVNLFVMGKLVSDLSRRQSDQK